MEVPIPSAFSRRQAFFILFHPFSFHFTGVSCFWNWEGKIEHFCLIKMWVRRLTLLFAVSASFCNCQNLQEQRSACGVVEADIMKESGERLLCLWCWQCKSQLLVCWRLKEDQHEINRIGKKTIASESNKNHKTHAHTHTVMYHIYTYMCVYIYILNRCSKQGRKEEREKNPTLLPIDAEVLSWLNAWKKNFKDYCNFLDLCPSSTSFWVVPTHCAGHTNQIKPACFLI